MSTADLPLRADVAHAAAQWFVHLGDGAASEADRQAWHAWRAADPEHERAWLRTEALTRQFDGLHPQAGLAALDRAAGRARGRRQSVKHLALLLMLGAAGGEAYRRSDRALPANRYRTATGQQRRLALVDGTSLLMNTATEVEIAFSAEQRLIVLHRGEIMLETGHERAPAFRPLRVATAAGTVTALGTRFIVRAVADQVLCSVQQGAVQVAPSAAGAHAMRTVAAGQQASFSSHGIGQAGPGDSAAAAWTTGMLCVDRLALGAFLDEVGRYRHGYLGCDPAVARLTISGAFPVADTDAIVQSLVDTLPLRATMLTRYWVRLGPR